MNFPTSRRLTSVACLFGALVFLPAATGQAVLSDVQLDGTNNTLRNAAELTLAAGSTLSAEAGSVVDLFNTTLALPANLTLTNVSVAGPDSQILGTASLTFKNGSRLVAEAGSTIDLSASLATFPSTVVLTTGNQTLTGKTLVSPLISSITAEPATVLTLQSPGGGGVTIGRQSLGVLTLTPGASSTGQLRAQYASVDSILLGASDNLSSGNPGGGGTKALAIFFPTAHRSGAPWVITSDTTNFGGPSIENDTIFLWGFNAVSGGNKVVDTSGVAGARKFYFQMEHDYYQVIGDSNGRMDEWHLNVERDSGQEDRLFQVSYFPASGTTSTGWTGSFQVFSSGSLNAGRNSFISPDHITSGGYYAVRNAADTDEVTVLSIDSSNRTSMGTNGQGITFNASPLRFDGNLDNSSQRPSASVAPIPGEIWGHSRQTPENVDGFLRLSAGGGSNPSTKTYLDISGFSSVPDMDRNIVAFAGGAERFRISSSGARINGYLNLPQQSDAPSTISGSNSLYFDTAGRLSWKAPDSFVRAIESGAHTTSRTIIWPDASGNIVIDSANQTLSGKTLTAPVINSAMISTPTISGTTTLQSASGLITTAAPNSAIAVGLTPSGTGSSATVVLYNSESIANSTYGLLSMGGGNGRELQLTTGSNGSAPKGDIVLIVGGVGEMLRLNSSGAGITTNQPIVSTNTRASASTTTGAFTVAGGAGIGGAISVGGNGTFGGRLRISNDASNTNEIGFYNSTDSLQYATIGIASANGSLSPNSVAQDLVVRSQSGLRLTAGGGTERLVINPSDGAVTVSSSAVSNSVGTGALVIGGGLGIAGDENLGGALRFSGAAVLTAGGTNQNVTITPSGSGTVVITSGIAASGTISTSTTTASTSTTTGALIVGGGFGLAGSLNIGGAINFTNSGIIAAGGPVSISAGGMNQDITLTPSGTGRIVLAGPATYSGTQTFNSALNLSGGGSVAGASGSLALSAGGTNQNITLTPSGSGRVAIASDLSTTGALTINSSLASTSTSTGAVVISGGAAVQKKLFLGEDLTLIPTSATSATVRLSGTAVPGVPGVWFADAGAPTAANAAISGTSTSTIVNAVSTGTVALRLGNTDYLTLTPSSAKLETVPLKVVNGIASSSTTTGSATFVGGIGVTGRVSAGSLAVGTGSTSVPVTGILSVVASLNFPSIAADGGVQDLTIAVSGATVGNAVNVTEAGGAFAPAGIVLHGIVTAANTVTVRATNVTAAAVDPAAISFRVTVTKF
jgi:hypothetical protein